MMTTMTMRMMIMVMSRVLASASKFSHNGSIHRHVR
jgi:hypothetical protein